MKKLFITAAVALMSMSAMAQTVNYQVRWANHPEDAKHYTTDRLRKEFLVEKVFAPNEVNWTYTMYDRFLIGGAEPVDAPIKIEPIEPLLAKTFLENREMGIINIGGPGVVTVDGKKYEIDTVGNAFIALKLAAGEHVIEFRYFPPGLKLGLILTFACWILFGFLCGRTQLQNRLEGAASGKRRRRSRSSEISDVEPSDIIEASKDDERLPESVRNEAEPSTDDDYYKHVDEILKDVFDDDKK